MFCIGFYSSKLIEVKDKEEKKSKGKVVKRDKGSRRGAVVRALASYRSLKKWIRTVFQTSSILFNFI